MRSEVISMFKHRNKEVENNLEELENFPKGTIFTLDILKRAMVDGELIHSACNLSVLYDVIVEDAPMEDDTEVWILPFSPEGEAFPAVCISGY